MVNYSETLAAFETELKRLLTQRRFLDEQIKKLLRVVEIIKTLAEESDEPVMQPPPMHPDEEAGFTQRVRAVLKANPFRFLSAVEVRDVLLKENPSEDSKVTLIHAHNTLKRLFAQGELEESDAPEGRKSYRFKTPSYGEVLGGLTGPFPNPTPDQIMAMLANTTQDKKK